MKRREPCSLPIARTLARHSILAVAALLPTWSAADSCDPDFGDKLYEWAQNDSRRQALELAKADFAARTINSRIVEYDDLRIETVRIADYLDRYGAEARRESDMLGVNPPDLAQAVIMQAQAAEAMNRLTDAGGKLDHMRQRLEILAAEPTLQRFVAEGAHHVGRTTLLESITPLARRDAFDLNARYSIYVEVTFDTDGNVKEASGKANGPEYLQAADTTAIAVLNYSTEPISKMVAAAYLVVRFVLWGNENKECSRKVEKQRERAKEATRLLSSTLPSGTETFAFYAASQQSAQARFSATHAHFEQARMSLADRWRNLMAITLARATLASRTLTAEKLETLHNAYNTDSPLARLFDSAALTRMLTDVSQVQSAIIAQELRVLGACRNAAGLRMSEDLTDAKVLAASALGQLQKVGRLAPVSPTLKLVQSRVAMPSPRAAAILAGAGEADCGKPVAVVLRTLARPVAISVKQPMARRPATTTRLPIGALGRVAPARTVQHTYMSTATAGGSFCTIYKSGEVYRCTPAGAAGDVPFPYDVGNGQDSARYGDVSSGGHDGGFARDSAAASQTVDASKANIEQRIRETVQKQAQIEQAVPAWLTGAESGSRAMVDLQRTTLATEQAFREAFIKAQQAALNETASRINQFAQQSGNTYALAALVKASDVVDATLSDVPRDAMVPDLPPIAGILPVRTAYLANSTLAQKRVAREAAKGKRIGDADARELHGRLVVAAERLAMSNEPSATAMVGALLEDALAQRLAGAADRTISVISDSGEISRVPYMGGDLPPTSILRRVDAFQNRSAVLAQQQAVARQALSSDAVDVEPRRRALEASEGLLARGQDEFYKGSVARGEGLLEAAELVADLVTSWTPGISWGRDIYESVSGKDLITGRTLENWERGAAVLGAVSVGIGSAGSKVVHAMRALEKAGVDIKRAEHIIEVARRIDMANAVPGVHAAKQMLERHIPMDTVEDVLHAGTRFFDVKDKSIICVQAMDEAVDGLRVVVAVDPDNLVDGERMLIRTVHGDELRTDAELAKAFIQGTTDRLRYILMPD
ncbi:MAG: pre-toxin TG domain-containing protein [Variovorax sp.]